MMQGMKILVKLPTRDINAQESRYIFVYGGLCYLILGICQAVLRYEYRTIIEIFHLCNFLVEQCGPKADSENWILSTWQLFLLLEKIQSKAGKRSVISGELILDLKQLNHLELGSRCIFDGQPK
jgi:hypothetical protein